jgi:hypothetical protein
MSSQTRNEDTASLVQKRAKALAAFEAWEAAQPGTAPAEDIIARIGMLWELLPPAARLPLDDPERHGVRRMHRMLAVLGLTS